MRFQFLGEIDFWIFLVLNAGAITLSGLAFREARKAKEEARKAGTIVKYSSVAMELTVLQSERLNELDPRITYHRAYQLLTDVSTKVRRLVTPLTDNLKIAGIMTTFDSICQEATTALDMVRPLNPEQDEEQPHAIYYAIGEPMSRISGTISEMIGILEKQFTHIQEG